MKRGIAGKEEEGEKGGRWRRGRKMRKGRRIKGGGKMENMIKMRQGRRWRRRGGRGVGKRENREDGMDEGRVR